MPEAKVCLVKATLPFFISHLLLMRLLVVLSLFVTLGLAAVTSSPSDANGKTFDYIVVSLLATFSSMCALTWRD